MSYLLRALKLYDRDPGRPFLSEGDGPALTYADLIGLSASLAGRLAGPHGLRRGERLLCKIEKRVEALILYLACVRAGVVFVPVNPAYTLSELDYFLQDCAPTLIVCEAAEAGDVVALPNRSQSTPVLTIGQDRSGDLAAGLARDTRFADAPSEAEDLAAILYTSGTTGRSKGAMLTHGNLAANALTLAQIWRFAAEDVLLHCLPVFHTHGLFVATNTVLASGASMIFQRRFEAAAALEALSSATVFMGVPTYFTRLLGEPGLTPASVAGVRLFISGSAPLPAEQHRAWTARTGKVILERYGMTETGMLTSNPYDAERKPGAVGSPLPGVSARIADPETGRVLATGETGMIEVSGPNVFAGYWARPELSAAEFRSDGYFITGDVGLIDEDGYVWIVGRGKDLIITGGLNVYPREVEAAVDALPGVVESAIIGLPHADFGEAVTAVVVVEGPEAFTEADALTALKARLAGFKTPKRVLVVSELPRNAMGKVQKAALRQQFADLYSGAH